LTLMRELRPHVVVQGNLHPLLLVSGGAAMAKRAGEIKRARWPGSRTSSISMPMRQASPRPLRHVTVLLN
jgi:hypothetical protein